ncbi:hypothetical protein E3O53_07890 [Cryobacterium sp. TMT2-18-3]|uniref:hypothetical protein n=1 Tax=unclassified Cryobacterium TaxID=2649013 RepID=UPI00106BED65|nr:MULTISPECIES: hypothetical protein [unclassified Cryobacterium]TFC26432.1 hypothetical protein E3O22_12420 [Cryobacterium sp. TMT2-18-2]TFC64390.1 hypothetical protein E3O53_07890 [Cryobacterium sp. TMT2-18-3]
MFDLLTSSGVLFTYTVNIPDRSQMQLVDFFVDSPFTTASSPVHVNVATLALVGKSVEQILVDHVEHHEAIAQRSSNVD